MIVVVGVAVVRLVEDSGCFPFEFDLDGIGADINVGSVLSFFENQ